MTGARAHRPRQIVVAAAAVHRRLDGLAPRHRTCVRRRRHIAGGAPSLATAPALTFEPLVIPARDVLGGGPHVALVLGGALSLWSDIRAVEAMIGAHWDTVGIVIAVNMAGVHWPGRLDHWVTLHPEFYFAGGNPTPRTGPWKSLRLGNSDYWVWTFTGHKHAASVHRTLSHPGGGSGLLAVHVALRLGCPRIVLAGMPIDAGAHFDRPGKWTAADRFQPEWEADVPKLGGRVRSMSGWSAQLLGRPTAEWILEMVNQKGEVARG